MQSSVPTEVTGHPGLHPASREVALHRAWKHEACSTWPRFTPKTSYAYQEDEAVQEQRVEEGDGASCLVGQDEPPLQREQKSHFSTDQGTQRPGPFAQNGGEFKAVNRGAPCRAAPAKNAPEGSF